MSRNIAPAIAGYFDGANARDATSAAAGFAEDGIVHDEGREHVGRAAIRDWVQETIERYAMTFVVKESSVAEDASLVVAEVSGTFPGSPVTLRFVFQVVDGVITRLDIAP